MVETIGPAGHTRRPARPRSPPAPPSCPARPLGGVAHLRRPRAARRAAAGGGRAPPYAGRCSDRRRRGAAGGCAERAILPQVRRQLPEHWRRLMPMPLAAGLYGVLLGLGFTTFVLSFGVWALAGISFALGDPAIGLAIGARLRRRPGAAGRGAGARSPIARPEARHRDDGRAAALYRGFRLGDAALLGILAVVLAGASNAVAARWRSQAAPIPRWRRARSPGRPLIGRATCCVTAPTAAFRETSRRSAAPPGADRRQRDQAAGPL